MRRAGAPVAVRGDLAARHRDLSGREHLALSCALALLLIPGAVRARKSEGLPDLDTVLKRLSRVADLYRDAALDFTCDETIYYAGPAESSLHRFSYIYGYSDEARSLQDYRTPRKRERAGRLTDHPALFGADGPPEFVARAYSWAFIFSDEVRPHHRYRLEGDDRLYGRPALRVRFEAVPPYRAGYNEWAGVAWVDRETYQILRVDAVRAEEHGTQLLYETTMALDRLPHADTPRMFEFSEYSTEFDVVKNGMRFPGRVVIERTTHTVSAGVGDRPNERTVTRYRVRQVYQRYRFFGVRTRQQIERIVTGD